MLTICNTASTWRFIKQTPASSYYDNMITYKNLSGNSGIKAYEIGDDSITVQFNSGDTYVYSYTVPGRDAVEAMKILAVKGIGLSTYISKVIRGRYEVKL